MVFHACRSESHDFSWRSFGVERDSPERTDSESAQASVAEPNCFGETEQFGASSTTRFLLQLNARQVRDGFGPGHRYVGLFFRPKTTEI